MSVVDVVENFVAVEAANFEHFADFAHFVAAEFERFPVDPFAGCVERALAVARRIAASSVADAVERESRWVADIGLQARDIDCFPVARDIVDSVEARDTAAEAVARDIVEQHLDYNFGEFHLDAALDSDPVNRKISLKIQNEGKKQQFRMFAPIFKGFCKKI